MLLNWNKVDQDVIAKYDGLFFRLNRRPIEKNIEENKKAYFCYELQLRKSSDIRYTNLGYSFYSIFKGSPYARGIIEQFSVGKKLWDENDFNSIIEQSEQILYGNGFIEEKYVEEKQKLLKPDQNDNYKQSESYDISIDDLPKFGAFIRTNN